MSPLALAIISVILSFFFLFLFSSSAAKKSKSVQKLPPGPRGLPIIGSLHILGNLPHQTLYHLAKKHGPIMSMRLGNVPTFVISSPKAAALVLKTHDTVFASRPVTQASGFFTYGKKGVLFTPYGPYWRNVRKLCVSLLLTSSKIESFGAMRAKEMRSTVERVKKCGSKGEMVNVSQIVSELIQSFSYKMILGRVEYDELNLKEDIHEMLRLGGAFNIADFIPFLARFELQGLTKRMKEVSITIDAALDNVLEKHQQDNDASIKTQERDFVDILLSRLNQPMNPQDNNQEHILTNSHIKAIILDMLTATLDTSSTTILWTLSELLKNPQVMLRLQDEIKNVVGVGVDRMVQETDLPKLAYLDMVIKETFRLHPPAPLLIPRESTEDVSLGEYFVPKKSRVLVNVWTIGRDESTWSDNAGEFMPMRFAGNQTELQGNDFNLIPFGAGRRGCPGMQLGLVNIRLVVAQMVHCFDWELPDGTLPETLDMTERFGLVVPRANDLFAKPSYRLSS